MGKPIAGVAGAQNLDRVSSRLHVRDLPLLINHERDTVRHTVFRQKNAIVFGDFAIDKVAEEGKREAKLFPKRF